MSEHSLLSLLNDLVFKALFGIEGK